MSRFNAILPYCLLTLFSAPLSAQENARAIVRTGLQAIGGRDRALKLKSYRAKYQGSKLIDGVTFSFKTSIFHQQPDQVKYARELEAPGERVLLVVVLNGAKAWISINGKTEDAPPELLQTLRTGMYCSYVETLYPLLEDKSFLLSSLGEVKLNDKPTFGVSVKSANRPDIALYFDKRSGLLVKSEYVERLSDGKMYRHADYYREYKEVGGLQCPFRIESFTDGVKDLEAEVPERIFVNRISDAEFRKP